GRGRRADAARGGLSCGSGRQRQTDFEGADVALGVERRRRRDRRVSLLRVPEMTVPPTTRVLFCRRHLTSHERRMSAVAPRPAERGAEPPLSAFAVPALALLVPLSISAWVVWHSDRFHHWFVLPVTACGILIGWDAARWLLGKVDLVDPVGVIGIYGFFFYFLAPL